MACRAKKSLQNYKPKWFSDKELVLKLQAMEGQIEYTENDKIKLKSNENRLQEDDFDFTATVPVSNTGSGIWYSEVKKVFKNEGVKEVCLKPIIVVEQKNRTDKIKKGTRVKYNFRMIPSKAHHRYNAPAKKAFGDITSLTDHNHSDNAFSITVSKNLHRIITNFQSIQRPEEINYQTKDGIMMLLKAEELLFENQINTFVQKSKENNTHSMEVQEVGSFLKMYKEGTVSKINKIKTGNKVKQELGLLIFDLNYAADCAEEQTLDAAAKAGTQHGDYYTQLDHSILPNRVAQYLKKSATKSFIRCSKKMAFIKAGKSLLPVGSQEREKMDRRFDDLVRLFQSKGKILLIDYGFNAEEQGPYSMSSLIEKCINPKILFDDNLNVNQKFKLLNRYGKYYNFRFLENKKYARLFNENTAWDELRTVYGRAINNNVPFTNEDFSFANDKKIQQLTESIRRLEASLSLSLEKHVSVDSSLSKEEEEEKDNVLAWQSLWIESQKSNFSENFSEQGSSLNPVSREEEVQNFLTNLSQEESFFKNENESSDKEKENVEKIGPPLQNINTEEAEASSSSLFEKEIVVEKKEKEIDKQQENLDKAQD